MRTSLVVAAMLALATTAWAEDPSIESSALAAPAAKAVSSDDENGGLLLGLRAGHLKLRDADDGTWLGGVQARLRLSSALSVEGAIEAHRDEFLDGDVAVTFYPVQVSGLLFPFPDMPLRPYALGGFGWYYTRISYKGALAALDDETEQFTGIHVGAGVELDLGRSVVLNGDIRYVFVDEPGVDNSNLDDEEWDYFEQTLGINFRM